MDYTIYYKKNYQKTSDIETEYDLFFSGFDKCERTKLVYEEVKANEKIWLVFPHYSDISIEEYKDLNYYFNSNFDEDLFFEGFIEKYAIDDTKKICIDITGFIRPHLVYFLKLLYIKGNIKKMDFLYSEPNQYENSENTTFTRDIVSEVADIRGCSAEFSNPNTENDILIVTSGYDDKLIQKVTQEYVKIKNKFFLIGFPSIQLDMYQESILKLEKILIENDDIFQKVEYAPAIDPFVTAQMIQDIIEKQSKLGNIYLCPISTKPHTLGIALYYLTNYKDKPISIVFPYSKKYSTKTARGMKRVWKYTIELQ